MYVDKVAGFDISRCKFTEVHFVKPADLLLLIKRKTRRMFHETTHTTLFGFDSRKSRTAQATRTMTIKSFHSPPERFNPPVAWPFVRPGANPLDAAARRSSASKWSSRGCGNLCDVCGVYDTPGGGEAGRLALKLPDMKEKRRQGLCRKLEKRQRLQVLPIDVSSI